MTETDPRRWWALGGVTLAVLAVGLDGTVLSVALPTLAESAACVGVRPAVVLVRLPARPRRGDAAARAARRPLRAKEGDARLARALRSRAPPRAPYSRTVGEFIAARVVLGIAGAGIIVMALSALTVLFSEEERPKAVGDLGGGELRRTADRPDPRRLAAHPLLVGLGLPAERPGRHARPDRHRGPRARLAGGSSLLGSTRSGSRFRSPVSSASPTG